MAGTPTGRAASTATAPAATADAAWSCPSERAPGNARNSPPGPTARESNSTVPVTWQFRGGLRRDVGQCAADDLGDVGDRQVDHRRALRPCSASASSTRSSNGRDLGGPALPGFMAFAGDHDHVAGPRPSRPRAGSPRAGPRSRPPALLPRPRPPGSRAGSRRDPRCAGRFSNACLITAGKFSGFERWNSPRSGLYQALVTGTC